MKATMTPRRLILRFVLEECALSIDELREGFRELVDRADLAVTGDELRAAFEDAVHPYPSLAEEQDAADDGRAWLCTCGHYQEDDFHCSCCGREPPWGCDCSDCNERAEREACEDDLDGYNPYFDDLDTPDDGCGAYGEAYVDRLEEIES